MWDAKTSHKLDVNQIKSNSPRRHKPINPFDMENTNNNNLQKQIPTQNNMSVQRIEHHNLHFQPFVHLLFVEELRFPAAAKIVA